VKKEDVKTEPNDSEDTGDTQEDAATEEVVDEI